MPGRSAPLNGPLGGDEELELRDQPLGKPQLDAFEAEGRVVELGDHRVATLEPGVDVHRVERSQLGELTVEDRPARADEPPPRPSLRLVLVERGQAQALGRR